MDPEKQSGSFREERVGEGGRVLGMEEGMYCDEPWMLYLNNESLDTASISTLIMYYTVTT